MSKTLKEIYKGKPFKVTQTEGTDKGKEYQFIGPRKSGNFEGG